MWFMASATANRYELVADLDEHIKFEGSGRRVRKEYLLDTPTERYDRTAPTDQIFISDGSENQIVSSGFVSEARLAFQSVRTEIREGSSEFDFRYSLVEHLFTDALGWTSTQGPFQSPPET